MCGLAGFVSFDPSKHPHNKKRFMEQTLYMNALRGMDSTGIATIDKDMKVDIYKRSMPSFDFLQLGPVGKLLDNLDTSVIALGHTRSSTYKGTINNRNAHPFQHGGVTMIHNGHVNNYRTLVNYQEFNADVDSEYIAYALSKDKDPIETLQKLDGAFCLVWHDAVRQTFNIARNKDRPLCWAYVGEWEGMAFASEQGMLGTVLDRINTDISLYDKEKFPCYWNPDPNTLYTWDLKQKDVKRYVSRPFVRTFTHITPIHPVRSKESTRGWDGTSETSDSNMSAEDSIVNTKVWNMRAVLAAHAKKWRPVTPKQRKKCENRMRGLGIQIDSVYGVYPRAWHSYETNGQNGFMSGRITVPVNGKIRRVIVHNVPQDYYKDHWNKTVSIRMESAYGMQGLGNWLCGSMVNKSEMDKALEELDTYGQTEVDLVTGETQDFFEGPDGEWMPQSEIEKLIHDAGECLGCNGKPDIDNCDQMLWVGEQYFCGPCVQNTDMQGYIAMAQAFEEKNRADSKAKDETTKGYDERYTH